MNKIILTLLSLILSGSLSLFAFGAEKPLKIDAGLGVSMAVINRDTLQSDSEYADYAGLLITLLSIRSGLSLGARYQITDSFSCGTEAGFYFMQVESDSGETVSFTDIPLRGLLRFGSKDTFLQTSAGYYLASSPAFGGWEAGATLSLGGFYASVFHTMGKWEFNRYQIGINLSEIFEF